MKQNLWIILVILSYASGMIVGGLAMKLIWPQTEIIIVSEPMTPTVFDVYIPSDRSQSIESVAKKIQTLDLPLLLSQHSPNHAEIASTWGKSKFKNVTNPFGSNCVQLITLVPRYASSDLNNTKYNDLAKSLNKELDASIMTIIQDGVKEAKSE